MAFTSFYAFSSAYFSSSILGSFKQKIDLRQPRALLRVSLSFLAIAFITTTTTILNNWYGFKVNRLSLRIRSAVLKALQIKLMRFSLLNSEFFSEGNLTNLVQVDAKRITDFFSEFLVIIRAFMHFLVGCGFMLALAGWRATLSVLGVYIAIYLLFVVCYWVRGLLAREYLFRKDRRMSYLQNVLSNAEYVKTAAAENYFSYELFRRREKELGALRATAWLSAGNSLLDRMAVGAALFSLVCYYTYFGGNEGLSPVTFFALYKVILLIKDPVYRLVTVFNKLVEFFVSVRRINRFLVAEEVGGVCAGLGDVEMDSDGLGGGIEVVGGGDGGGEVAVVVRGGWFCWKKDEKNLIESDVRIKRELSRRGVGVSESGGEGALLFADPERSENRGKRVINVRSQILDSVGFQPNLKQTQSMERGRVVRGYSRSLERLQNDLKSPQKSEKKFQKKTAISSKKSGPGLGNEAASTSRHQESTSPLLQIEQEVTEAVGAKKIFFLKNINLTIKKGEIVIIFGQSGSGKSSLLYSILGEMKKLTKTSKIAKFGKTGFMDQSRWIIRGSILVNITMGKEFDAELMNKALEYARLGQDVRNLPRGLETIIGSEAATISGGQRDRITLARCFYQE